MLSATEMANYEFTQRMAGQHGRGVNKSLDAVVRHKVVKYVVRDCRVVVFEGDYLQRAVDFYNEI